MNILKAASVELLLAADQRGELLDHVDAHGVAAVDEVGDLLQGRQDGADHLLFLPIQLLLFILVGCASWLGTKH
jgi:hypothetical protein